MKAMHTWCNEAIRDIMVRNMSFPNSTLEPDGNLSYKTTIYISNSHIAHMWLIITCISLLYPHTLYLKIVAPW